MKWLIRLYPASWRRRYEEEFRAFLDQEGSLSLRQRFDFLRGIVDARRAEWTAPRDREKAAPAGMIRQVAGSGILFTASSHGGAVMRRQPLAILCLLLGATLGLLAPYARQTVAATFSNTPPGYWATLYQDVLPFTGPKAGLTSIDIVNTGRDMPRLVAVVPPNRTVTPTGFEGQRDHKAIVLRYLHLGHGTIAYSLGPLTHGHTATLRMWWRVRAWSAQLQGEEPVFYGEIPHFGTHISLYTVDLVHQH
jgi:hypothetical protein